ncbi:hypothetical protein BT63DRAFT_457980 [Microthyrium microscopicum]|uniref:BTB domain-containing protein n=1 Tax=Microthyrium microscopicum TaxID=703497 RepID=A0A6A6U4F3_9PEZI|nr:hypothetical protein BT63DRAFT_457980 [Microthyrium microscopicum]
MSERDRDFPNVEAMDTNEALAGLWMNNLFSDLEVVCGKQRWPVHKAIVCAKSGYLWGHCVEGGNTKSWKINHVHIRENNPLGIQYALKFMYDGIYPFARTISRKELDPVSETYDRTINCHQIEQRFQRHVSLIAIADILDCPSLHHAAMDHYIRDLASLLNMGRMKDFIASSDRLQVKQFVQRVAAGMSLFVSHRGCMLRDKDFRRLAVILATHSGSAPQRRLVNGILRGIVDTEPGRLLAQERTAQLAKLEALATDSTKSQKQMKRVDSHIGQNPSLGNWSIEL